MVWFGRSVSQLLPMEKQSYKVLVVDLSEKSKTFPGLCFNSLPDSSRNTCGWEQSAARSRDCSWWCHKNCEFYLLTFKEASNVFRRVQRHGRNAMRILHHGEVRWLSGGKVLKRVFQLRLAGFPCSTKISNVSRVSRQPLSFKIAPLVDNISEHKSFHFVVARKGMGRFLNFQWGSGV